jgi:hypothetical protein
MDTLYLCIPPNAEVKNAWSYTFTPLPTSMAYCSIKHSINLIFMLFILRRCQ